MRLFVFVVVAYMRMPGRVFIHGSLTSLLHKLLNVCCSNLNYFSTILKCLMTETRFLASPGLAYLHIKYLLLHTYEYIVKVQLGTYGFNEISRMVIYIQFKFIV